MMEIADEITIPAPRAVVYEALNDIAILKACIPGCESLERESDTKLVAKVTLKIGPVKAKFNGTVMLDQSKAPDGGALKVVAIDSLGEEGCDWSSLTWALYCNTSLASFFVWGIGRSALPLLYVLLAP